MSEGAIIDGSDVLIVVDVQNDFCPGGALAVPRGDEVVPIINRLAARFRHVVLTQDWHPGGHFSFASTHPGRRPYETIAAPYGPQVLWPDHALQGSDNAALHPALDMTKVEVIVRKGFDPAIDSYSTFFENDHRTATGLDGWLRQRGFRRVFLAGLATDFCVAWSAEDAVRLGYEVTVIEDACRGIGIDLGNGRTTLDEARDRLSGLGVRMVKSEALTA